MTVLECEQRVLGLLDEVGTTDYSNRIYDMISEAQTVIATTWGFIRKKAVLTCPAGEAVPLPEDCYAVEEVRGGSWTLEPVLVGEIWRPGIALSGGTEYTLIYKAYPDKIGENDGNKKIQIPEECHAALCCYVAALTQGNEYDKRAYQIFMGRYTDAMALVERARQNAGKARVIIRG